MADAEDDAYDVTLTTVAWDVTFDFTDADDVVTLSSSSSISGFTQLKVIRGTVDVSDADIGRITYVRGVFGEAHDVTSFGS